MFTKLTFTKKDVLMGLIKHITSYLINFTRGDQIGLSFSLLIFQEALSFYLWILFKSCSMNPSLAFISRN